MIKLVHTELSKSKKDNIYCLYFEFDSRCFGVENIYTSEEEGELQMTLGFSSCENDEVFQEFVFAVPDEVMDAFEYLEYNVSKSKEELYVYFYEYPYDKDDIEDIQFELKRIN